MQQQQRDCSSPGEPSPVARKFRVENVVQANLKACLAPAASCAGRVFNIACGQRITLNQTYAILQRIIGYEGPPCYEAERAGDVKHSLADIGAARAVLGYEPTVDFEEGLKRTVTWYRMPAAKSEKA
jgi:UDP-glucose 4-epimerase